MTNEPQDFDIGKIRELLLAAFDVDELERFCKDRPAFSPICLRFSPAMGLDDRVDEVLDYCGTQLLLPELLQQVAEVNWRQYAQFQPDLGSSAPPIPPEPALETRPTAPPTPVPLGGRPVYWIGGLVVGALLLLIAGWAIARVLTSDDTTPVPSTSVPAPIPTEPVPTTSVPTPIPPRRSFQILLDRSEAMEDLLQGQKKLEMAKDEIAKTLDTLDDRNNLALRLFGGRCDGTDRETSQLVVPFGQYNRRAVGDQLQVTETQGNATLVRAITQATNDFDYLELSEMLVTRIIVITGSDKFCTEDCEELKQAFRDILEYSKGITIETRVIGLDLPLDQQNCFKEIEQLPGVRFDSAKNSAELGVAVAAAFAGPAETPVTLPPPTDTPVTPLPPSVTPVTPATPSVTPVTPPPPSVTPVTPPTPTDTSTPTPSVTPVTPPPPTDTPVTPPPPSVTPVTPPTPTDTGTPTPTLTSTPTPTPYPASNLLAPAEGATLTGKRWFRWQGMPLPDNLAYDLRIWRKGESPFAALGVDKPTTETQLFVDLRFVPAISKYGEADYYWTVLVVEVVETETGDLQVVNDVGQWAEERNFKYKTITRALRR